MLLKALQDVLHEYMRVAAAEGMDMGCIAPHKLPTGAAPIFYRFLQPL
jgi:hypothetical protein